MDEEYVFIKNVLQKIVKYLEANIKDQPELYSPILKDTEAALEKLQDRNKSGLERAIGKICIEHSCILGEKYIELLMQTNPFAIKSKPKQIPGQTELPF